jgi:hypothetical protein
VDRDRAAINELHELLSAACDGRCDAASIARLETLLTEHDRDGELLIEYSMLHTDLWRMTSASRAEAATEAMIAARLFDAPAEQKNAGRKKGERRRTRQIATPTSWRRIAHSRLFQAAAAASLLLSLGIALWSPRAKEQSFEVQRVSLVRPPQPVACLTETERAVWAGGQVYRDGQTLEQNLRLELTQGMAQISMACGADVVLQAPCSVVLATDDLVQLEKGKLTAQAAKWATGFVVETQGLRITDLGTRFAVSTESSGTAEAHVLEGSVLAEPLKSHQPRRSSMLLRSGQAIRVNVNQASVDRLTAQRNRFFGRLDEFRPLRPIDIWNTGYGLTIGDSDPRWHIIAGPDASQNWPIPAVVGQAASVYRDNAPDESQWISVPEGTTKGVPPNTTYTFETTFNLSGFDLSTVRVIGQMLADNGVSAIRLNGKPVDIVPWEERVGDYDFRTFHVVKINDGFIEGKNRLEIDVFNTSWGGDRAKLPTPMGLRVEWRAFGRPPAEESSPTGRLDDTL